jgi:hypothetical protein
MDGRTALEFLRATSLLHRRCVTYKAGTTWVTTVANLIFGGGRLPRAIHDISSWLDRRIFPLGMMLTEARAADPSPLDQDASTVRRLAIPSEHKYVHVGGATRRCLHVILEFLRQLHPTTAQRRERCGRAGSVPSCARPRQYPCILAQLDEARIVRVGGSGLSGRVSAASRSIVVGLSPAAQHSVHFADLLGDLKAGN